MTRCDCGRQWTAQAECHCSVCHEQFSAVRAFDAHRVADGTDGRKCADPSQLLRNDGQPVLVATMQRHGTVWRWPGHAPQRAGVSCMTTRPPPGKRNRPAEKPGGDSEQTGGSKSLDVKILPVADERAKLTRGPGGHPAHLDRNRQ